MRAPVVAWIGPWNHDFPDSGTPGPNHDWREAALAWWDHWLGGIDRGVDRWSRLAVYVRDGHPPGSAVTVAPGHWRSLDWPDDRICDRPWQTLAPRRLVECRAPRAIVPLVYHPGTGLAAGEWWGDVPGDMAADDVDAACFDSAPMDEPLVIIGAPRARLVYRPRCRLVHVAARLEDVAPDGRVTLVTGAGLNGWQTVSRTAPRPLRPGELVGTDLPLHFTTWTFQRGHRIRLVVTHSQFPMLWPTPELTSTELVTGEGGTSLTLPVAPRTRGLAPTFPPPQQVDERPGSVDLPGSTASVKTHGRDPTTGRSWYQIASDYSYNVDGRRYEIHERLRYCTDPARPADSRADGIMSTRIEGISRPLELTTHITVRTDAAAFYVEVRRALSSRGRPVTQRTWHERIARDGH